MKNQLHRIVVATALGITSLSIEAAGFRELQVDDPGHRVLTVGVWYPTNASVAKAPNTDFGMAVARDAAVVGANGGLVLLSHGFSGWYAGHADTAEALAEAGFIVAAPSHSGNTWSDMSSSVDQWLLDRPRHISRTLDAVLSDQVLGIHIDESSVGVYGFSAGGYTALSLIGAVPDFERAAQHCKDQPQEYACAEGMIDELLAKNMDELPAAAWGADARIKAAVISAPGFGFAYSRASLANVTASVQLWSGELDAQVRTETNAATVAAHLPVRPETHWVADANHFAFLVMPCRDAFKRADPEEYEIICADREGFDRHAFHDDMHQEMTRFYNAWFGFNQ